MLCLVLALLSASPAHTPWDPILQHAGLTAQSLQISPTKWRGGGKYALSTFNACWDDWRKLEPTTLALARTLLRSADHPDRAIAQAEISLDQPDVPPAGPVRTHGLKEAILACGGAARSDAAKLDAALKSVPADVQALAATALGPMPKAAALRRRAFAWLDTADAAALDRKLGALAPEALAFASTYDLQPHSLELVEKTDVGALAEAARLIARAAVSLRDRHPSQRPFHFDWNTALGRIELSGGGNDVHNLDGALLVMDTGGDDTYVGGSIDHPGLTTVIDFAGNDRYRNCGLAVFGVVSIFDFSGNDVYECEGAGNGAGLFGAALLFDAAGSDRYVCRDLGEGAAVVGIGLLIDLSSDDDYSCRALAQGFGGVRGFGALVDVRGNDSYTADDVHIDNPSPQTAEHNVSLAQGAGFGRRADPGDGHSMAGGIGLLAEGAGDDRYRCGVFGQGVGYWYALGGLVDFGGRDSYDGVWYVQGSAAHYALGCLLDLSGNDAYLARMHQSQGQGHDYSIGLLHDFSGDDRYECRGGGALGSGRWNGLGLFADSGGRNTYAANGESFGFVADHRPEEACFGLFADLGHAFFPPARKELKAGGVWMQQIKAAAPIVLGAGWSAK